VNPPPNDQHPLWSGGQALVEELRILPSAQGKNTVQRPFGLVEPGTRSCAGGDQDTVERDALPIGKTDLLGRAVQTRRCNAQPPLDICQRRSPRQLRVLCRNPTRQHGLRERWAVVGEIRFIPNEGQVSVKALGTEGFRRAESGEGSAHNHDAPAVLESSPGSVAMHVAPGCACGALPLPLRRR
jgi:hypothetical protein